MFKENLKIAKG